MEERALETNFHQKCMGVRSKKEEEGELVEWFELKFMAVHMCDWE